MGFRDKLAKIWDNIQYHLFPDLQSRLGPLLPTHKKLASILELIRIEDYLPCTQFHWGRPVKSRCYIARAFIAKIVFKIQYTHSLIRELNTDRQLKVICGWDSDDELPSESTFSRAFAEFSKSQLPLVVHQELVKKMYENKIIGHLIKDSFPIEAREKAQKKEGTPKERKKANKARLAKERREGNSRKQKQLREPCPNRMVEELPKACDIGSKTSPDGHKQFWRGYKFHLASTDDCIPIACVITSASLNDCEAAIPLAAQANLLVTNFYDLMDSAYDTQEIKEYSLRLGHIPIIDPGSRTKEQKAKKQTELEARKTIRMEPAEAVRYKSRFPGERINAQLLDYYGGRNIAVKGHCKIYCHMMFGVLALTASSLFNLL